MWQWWVALLVVLGASDVTLGVALLGTGRIDELTLDWPKRGQSLGCLMAAVVAACNSGGGGWWWWW